MKIEQFKVAKIDEEMKSTHIIFNITIISVLIILGLSCDLKTKEPITKEEAIQLAEQFIIDNGYTNLPADKSKLSFELFDQNKINVDSILKHRYNTLKPKAFCISEDKDLWNVGFLSNKVDLNRLDSIQRQSNLSGRAVIVMKDGKAIRIAHKTPLFSYFIKL